MSAAQPLTGAVATDLSGSETIAQRLAGRVAIVTGAARGLGAGIARALAKEGATVVRADLPGHQSGREQHASEDSRDTPWIDLDVTDREGVEEVVQSIHAECGSIDILVNNAGVMQPESALIDTPQDVIASILAVNVIGTINCSQAVGRVMQAQRSGRIILIASQTGKLPWPGMGIYAASKAAVISLTQCFALELAPWNILVNCICPGTMWSPGGMTEMVFAREAAKSGITLDDALRAKAKSIPLGRLGTPEDVGAMAAWMASDDLAFTTGASFNLTGGEQVFF
jgi:3-oxoacyl-[acyl-carrier protein] reductase